MMRHSLLKLPILLLLLLPSACAVGPIGVGPVATSGAATASPTLTVSATATTTPTTAATSTATVTAIAETATTAIETEATSTSAETATIEPAEQTAITTAEPVTETVVAEPSGSVVIEATYAYTPTDDVPLLQLSPPVAEPRAGVRLVLPLAPGGIQPAPNALEIRSAVADDAPVSFWIARAATEDSYILVSVGADTEPLDRLRLNTSLPPGAPLVPPELAVDPIPLTEEARLTRPIGGPDTQIEQITVWLEAPSGVRHPLDISAIGHAATVEEAKELFSEVVLVLVAQPDATYTLFIASRSDSMGPPNEGIDERCDRWPANSWYYSWLRTWYGCPRKP